jgi:hypothetical protein
MSKTLDEQLDAMTPEQLASVTTKVNEANERRAPKGQQQEQQQDDRWKEINKMGDSEFYRFSASIGAPVNR